MTTTGLITTGVAGVAILIVGVLYLLWPRVVAAGFGLPVPAAEEATAWLRLKGIRDLVAGLAAVALLLTAEPRTIGWVLLAYTVIPIGDAVTVLAAKGKAAAAWGLHGCTAVVMLLGAVLLLIG